MILSSVLEKKGLRKTQFRLSVLRVFEKFPNAVTTAQIENELKDFDRITLYRTLKSFKDKGVIHEISLSDEDKKFALCEDTCSTKVHQHNHLHFHCLACSELFCVPINSFPEFSVDIGIINELEITAKGVCNSCR